MMMAKEPTRFWLDRWKIGTAVAAIALSFIGALAGWFMAIGVARAAIQDHTIALEKNKDKHDEFEHRLTAVETTTSELLAIAKTNQSDIKSILREVRRQ